MNQMVSEINLGLESAKKHHMKMLVTICECTKGVIKELTKI